MCSLQETNRQLVHQFRQENTNHERTQLILLEQQKLLQDQCNQLEHDLSIHSRHKMICSICLDQADDIISSKRQVMSTFCGHIFCDYCLNRSTIFTQSNKQLANDNVSTSSSSLAKDNRIKRFTCPQCRNSVKVSEVSKFAHALYF